MIKKTLYFANPTYLKLQNKQLHIHVKTPVRETKVSRAMEDIGMVILDNPRITITHNAIKALQHNNVAIISCDDKRMPHSIMLPMEGHTLQSERMRVQITASIPLKKNLWQQTVIAKINNQIRVLEALDKPVKRLYVLKKNVSSGDSENREGQAAAYYWKTLIPGFVRDRYGEVPNNLLNYGYAILRSMVARAVVSSGLHPTFGIYHHNKYNAYCLADDLMEPFRPFVDLLVYQMYIHDQIDTFLSTTSKQKLLALCAMDGLFGRRKSPIMVGMSQTSSSLYQCYAGKKRKIVYPQVITSNYVTQPS